MSYVETLLSLATQVLCTNTHSMGIGGFFWSSFGSGIYCSVRPILIYTTSTVLIIVIQ